MADDPLHIESDPDPAVSHELDELLYQYNVAQTGHTDGKQLAIIVRGPSGDLIAGLSGTTWSGWLDIRLLWVHERERGRGLGTQLLAAAEAEARARGCHTAIVDTHSFQAPDFYQRHGYRIYATLDGYPTGHSKVFLRKSLREHPAADEAAADEATTER
ncbi:MAG: GNAT family N-acetyltransferase [Chloroflexota bacterium]